MARSTRTDQPVSTPQAPAEVLPVQESSHVRRLAETAIAVAMTPFAVAQQVLPPDQPAGYYGGLTAAAVVGLIEWPVAAAIAAGVWIARSGQAPR